ncbi:MAG: DNA gyrase inhibitor YacG [Acidobacteria bacterium]|nr:DNA gyrase inhibitor YacG [Acidobacteriota bacterium]
MRCPICKTETTYSQNPYRPFCSERCKMTDLGNWASERYSVNSNQESEEGEPYPLPGEMKEGSD